MASPSRIDYLPVEREGDNLPGDEFAGSLQRFFRSHFESAAARDLHAHDGDGLDVVLAQDLRQLLRVVHGVKLGASEPLAEFWQPANLGAIRRVLETQLADFNPEVALKFFEFPTEAVWNGKRLGRPSMTDIMILDADWQIAVEGKFTEYLYGGGKTVIEWLRECTSVTDAQFRRDVLRAWISYIREARCTDIPTVGELCRS